MNRYLTQHDGAESTKKSLRTTYDSFTATLTKWKETPLSITSINFLKQDEIMTTFSSSRWDLHSTSVVAHLASANGQELARFVRRKRGSAAVYGLRHRY